MSEHFQRNFGISRDMGIHNGTIFIAWRPIVVAVFLYMLVAMVLSPPPTDALHAQWCVADPQAPDNILQGALDWACGPGGADCSAIQWNQPCYLPNTLASHASYAFNSYWQKAKHRGASCHFNAAAFVTESNPSHDACQFVYVP